MFSQYGGLYAAIRMYWKDYGGWADFVRSPMVHFSLLISLLKTFGLVAIDWRVLTTGMMPTVLGFSLAAYAITFALMGSKLHASLAAASDSAGMPLARGVNATLFHNVFVQSLALSFSVISNGDLISRIIGLFIQDPLLSIRLDNAQAAIGSWTGTFLLVYAILLLFSSGIAMFRLGRLLPTTPKSVPANDSERLQPGVQETARELYGFRWSLIRGLAWLLRVRG